MISYKIVFWVSLIAIIPVFFWLTFFRTGEKSAWGKGFLLGAFWLGVISSLLAVFLEIFYFENKNAVFLTGASGFSFEFNFFFKTLASVLPVALIEELSKSLVIFWAIAKRKILTLRGGLLIGVLAGLSFAVTENGVYFARFFSESNASLSGEFWQVVFLRFIFSTSAHIIYSGLCGFFLAEFLAKNTWQGKIFSFFKAFFVPMTVHTLFNSLLETNFGWLIFLIVLFGLGVIYFLYSRKSNSLSFRAEGRNI